MNCLILPHVQMRLRHIGRTSPLYTLVYNYLQCKGVQTVLSAI